MRVGRRQDGAEEQAQVTWRKPQRRHTVAARSPEVKPVAGAEPAPPTPSVLAAGGAGPAAVRRPALATLAPGVARVGPRLTPALEAEGRRAPAALR